MKFSVFSVMMPDCSIEETVKLLKQNGYDGVEWRFTDQDPARVAEAPSFWGNNLSTIAASSTPAQLEEVKKLTADIGLELPNLASYIQAGDIAATEQAMKAAKILGAPSIRVGVPSYNGTTNYWDALQLGRSYLAEVEALSQQYGVKGSIEIHFGNIACSASAARRLVEGFNPDHIGVIYDPGNMVREGFENYQMGLEILGPYLAHVHIKNGVFSHKPDDNRIWQAGWAGVDQGIVHWPEVFAALRAVGYDGWLSMEDFSLTRSTEENLEFHLSYIKSML